MTRPMRLDIPSDLRARLTGARSIAFVAYDDADAPRLGCVGDVEFIEGVTTLRVDGEIVALRAEFDARALTVRVTILNQ